MAVRVLVVDDSRFFRRRLTEILDTDPQIEVIGSAENGSEAVTKVVELCPDVVTMDVEMPVLDGISSVREIMSRRPTPVLMFSSLTQEGAQASLDALDAGAVDFLPKKFEDIARDRDEAKELLRRQVRALGKGLPQRERGTERPSPPTRSSPSRGVKLVLIGASTGGPVALQEVLKGLPANFSVPILLIQHMPESFTRAFAARLDQLCPIKVREAIDGEPLAPGTALLAPGGQQMSVIKHGNQLRVSINEATPEQYYRPSLDVTFESASSVLPGQVLAVVLTGMGHDGREGARLLKGSGSSVWAQDEASSIIYGMPMAVAEAGLADRVLPLSKIGTGIVESV